MIQRFLTKEYRQLPKDEFIDRILCSVAGMTKKNNIYLMDKGISAMPENADILEIGSFAGQSAIIMNYLMKKHNKKGKIICIDPYVYEGWFDLQKNTDDEYLNSVGQQTHINRLNYLHFIHASFVKNTNFFCSENVPLLYKITSNDFFEKFKNNLFPELLNLNIGFCYIDGEHSKDTAFNDMKNCLNISIKSTMILMDDTDTRLNLGSVEATKEIKKLPNIKVVLSNPNILFQKIY
jgi:hypothetical protein